MLYYLAINLDKVHILYNKVRNAFLKFNKNKEINFKLIKTLYYFITTMKEGLYIYLLLAFSLPYILLNTIINKYYILKGIIV